MPVSSCLANAEYALAYSVVMDSSQALINSLHLKKTNL